jgi:hypothetical protein
MEQCLTCRANCWVRFFLFAILDISGIRRFSFSAHMGGCQLLLYRGIFAVFLILSSSVVNVDQLPA